MEILLKNHSPMAKMFIIKASKGKNDPFFMYEANEFVYFFSPTLKDLRATLRCITSKGYRIPKEATLSKRIKAHRGHLVALNPFFRTTMYEVLQVDKTLKIENELEYVNSFGFSHNLKIVGPEVAASLFGSDS